MAESLASMRVTQPKVTLETLEIPLLPEDYSRNCPSTSDVFRLQQNEGSVEELDLGIQGSMLSDSEVREKFDTASPVLSLEDFDLEPPEAVELLMCVEEPEVEMMEDIPQTTFTPATPLSVSPAFIYTPAMDSEVIHRLPCPQELPFSVKLLAVTAKAERHTDFGSDSADKPCDSNEYSLSVPDEAPVKAEPQCAVPAAPAAPSFQLPVLLFGAAALVAIVGVTTFVRSRK